MTQTMNERQLLQKSFAACRVRVENLLYSVQKNSALFPLTLATLSALGEVQKESLDAFVFRYSQCVSMMQDQLFKGIALAEQEDLSDKSNRDKTMLMEKLGAIQSADEFGIAAVLRNKFAHHYPAESKEQLEKLNLLYQEAQFVVTAFEHLLRYAVQKGLLVDDCPVHYTT
jgi:hypothetical protein